MIIKIKHIVLLSIVLFCSSFAIAQNNSRSFNALRFIKGIEINATPVNAPKKQEISEERTDFTNPINNQNTEEETVAPSSIEYLTSINFKYGQMLNTEVELLKNISLYTFIEEWLNTKYLYGGVTKSGVDCSGFVGNLHKSVYGVKLPRTARDQYQFCEKISSYNMREGDLVFFNTRGGVSHVGVYLANDYFVHSSTSRGVTISSLKEDYYMKRFIGSGRAVQLSADQAVSLK